MKSPADLQRDNEGLRNRISRLSEAVRRINASLDLDTVLKEIVDRARSLTGARCGIITPVDASGEPRAFVSSGFTAVEHSQLATWSKGSRLLEQLRDVEIPLRVSSLPANVRASDSLPDGVAFDSLRCMPLRHRGRHVGIFLLADQEGESGFTDTDEQVLTLFASQATTAIANARTYRDERRARADLEALVETSPVGVVVLDATTGRLASLNLEARRIVEGLRIPGHSVEAVLDVLTCRRDDGREIALDALPLAEALGSSETVRSEEMELSVPDGRRVRALVNVTPIRSEDGTIVSVVVTMQDLAPLEELERLRAQFLGLVSHQLRAPLASIKGSAATALGASPALDRAEMVQFFRIIEEQADQMRGLIADLVDIGRIEAGTLSVELQPTEVRDLVEQAQGTYVSGGGRHPIRTELPPDLPRVMADRQRIVQVLNNLLKNAARNSSDLLPIEVGARRDGVHVAISVSDQGRGVPQERLPLLFRKHEAFDRVDGDGSSRGYGLGLSICRGLVDAHGGRIWAQSGGAGHGARFTFTVPAVDEVAADGHRPTRENRSSLPRTAEKLPRILVVDDDPEMQRYCRDVLVSAGYSPYVTGNPAELGDLIRTTKPALVLLDLLFPETDGIQVMERVPELEDLPVITIAGYGRDETIARALALGAVDYVVTPFSSTELVARVQAALRRVAGRDPFVLGDLTIHYVERMVTMGDRRVNLTATEFELLRVLSAAAGRVVTTESLLQRIWGERDSGDPRLVRAFIGKLRTKLGDQGATPKYVLTERGVGYRMPRPPVDP